MTPDWRRWHARLGWRVPREVRAWVADQGSLTRRVVARCPGRFRVRVARQAWERPLPSEARLLGSPSIALCREVLLLCEDQPWVFARTLIPRSSLRGGVGRLRLLGERPLGEVLFANPSTRRLRMEVARLIPRDRLWRHAAHAAGMVGARPLWGRRTLFLFSGKPLLVNEIFLPDLESR